MGFDNKKIDRLLNGSQEALFYGFTNCDLYTVTTRLCEQGYSAYTCSNSPFLNIDPHDISGYHCKKIIVNLMEENYKRQQKGESIIPLIFVVGFEDGKNKVALDIHRVAYSHNTGLSNNASVTDTELRRCYKIYAESNDAMRKLAEETFKFVIFKSSTVGTRAYPTYELVPIDPFWNKPEWNNLWLKRASRNPLKDFSIWNKKLDDNWRAQLNRLVNDEVTSDQSIFPALPLCNIF